MISGSFPPFFILPTSSVTSSMIVRSAAVSVSNTFLKPRRLSAAIMLLVHLVPIGIPNSSPSAALTAGAVCTTTWMSLLCSASQTRSVSSRSLSAPTGQTLIHCPQLMQGTSASDLSNAEPTIVLNPLSLVSMTPTCCTFLHIFTQRLQSTHLLGSLTIEGERSSIGCSIISPSNLISFMLRSSASFCSSQFLLLTQVRHFFS